MIKRLIQYITHDIWYKTEHEYKSGKARWAVRQIKVFLFTARGVGAHDIIVRSAALTFYTLISLVPVAALAFSISKGFGLEVKLTEYLYAQFPQYTLLIDQLTTFANSTLERAKGGVIASVGLVVLFWAAIRVFSNIENAFNKIWEVHRARSWTRKASNYLSIVLIAPVLLIISNSILINFKINILNLSTSFLAEVLSGFISLVVLCVMFVLLFYSMPNTTVKISSAIRAGIITGVIFQLFQFIYIYIQSGVSAYNAIYGSFAAIPLFLIWLQTSWQIMLFGAELSFSYQNIKRYEYEKLADKISYDFRRKILVVVMRQIALNFVEGKGGISSDTISQKLNLPVRSIRDAIFELEKAGLIAAIVSDNEKTNFYIPIQDVHTLTIYDIIREVEKYGTDSLAGLEPGPELRKITALMDKADKTLKESPENTPILNLK